MLNPYVVFAGEELHNLSKSQLDFADDGSFLKEYFSQDSNSNKVLTLEDCDPRIFKIIKSYLSGYEILPLSKERCDSLGMSVDEVQKWLKKDAQHLGLKKLVEEIDARAGQRSSEDATSPSILTTFGPIPQETAKLQGLVTKLSLEIEKLKEDNGSLQEEISQQKAEFKSREEASDLKDKDLLAAQVESEKLKKFLAEKSQEFNALQERLDSALSFSAEVEKLHLTLQALGQSSRLSTSLSGDGSSNLELLDDLAESIKRKGGDSSWRDTCKEKASENAPIEDKHTEDLISDATSVRQHSNDDEDFEKIDPVPVEGTTEEKPEEKPAEEAPPEEKPAEEAPPEEKPVEEAPPEEKPAEVVSEEKPAEEKPAEEKPAEGVPLEQNS